MSTAWPVSGPETRIASASEEKTALLRAELDRARVERGGEFRIDVEEQLQVRPAEIAAERQRVRGIRLPEAHVGGEEAGEDLADEGRAGGAGDRDGGGRDPRDS